MYKPNNKHRQNSIFGFGNTLSDNLLKKLYESEEYYFYNMIFCNIDEGKFKVLYSDNKSRPNAPVNCMVSALLLKEKYHWTYEQLFKNISFNILTKTALGLDTLDDIPFNQATLFNFQNRLLKHQVETGENLIEQLFDGLTKKQIKELKIKTDIQRADSLMASSNIRSYSRLQLLVEILLRLWKIMDDEDKEIFESQFSDYTGKSSGQYIYKLTADELPREINKIAEIYHFCKHNIMPKYEDTDFSKIFERVYSEHFTECETKIEVKSKEELTSNSLQSPDDLDATYRKKRGESFKGQSINVMETASKENPVNLLTDVDVNANNVDDSNVLSNRIEIVKNKTPDLNELHTDGGFGSEENDKLLEALGIRHVQTAVRGRQSEVTFIIEMIGYKKYKVTCPLQIVESEPTRKRNKSMFDNDICQTCPFAGKCPANVRKTNRTFYFTYEDYLRNKRNRNILEIPVERRKIRPNVEATVHEFTCRMTNKKLKVRGAFKTELFAFSTAIGINFGRIFRYITQNPLKAAFSLLSLRYFAILDKELLDYRNNSKLLLCIRKYFSKTRVFTNIHLFLTTQVKGGF